MWKLFIDDVRDPVDSSWIIARTSNVAIQLVTQLGMPNEISFDHDLGGEDTSMKFLGWVVDGLITKDLTIPSDFKYSVHSMNPVGKDNIECLLENIRKHFTPR